MLKLGDDDTPMTWTLAEPKGHGPSPRFNHTIAYFPKTLVISGGRDNSQTFSDMHLLDLETMTWQDSMSTPSLAVGICNNVCSAIESVPNYKLFTFGGKKGIMDYINSVDVMDCGQLVWNTMNVMGKPPCPREDTAWIYDNKSCCLVVFGGWANRWMGDTWKLNISAIIGPHYACMRITQTMDLCSETPSSRFLVCSSGNRQRLRSGLALVSTKSPFPVLLSIRTPSLAPHQTMRSLVPWRLM